MKLYQIVFLAAGALALSALISKYFAGQTFYSKGVFTLNAQVLTGTGASDAATIGPLTLTVQ